MLKNLKCTYFTNNTAYKEHIERGNRHIIKIGGKTITIYGHSLQMLNVTGIKSWSDMKATKMMIQKEFQVKDKKEDLENCKNRIIIGKEGAYHRGEIRSSSW